MLVRVSDQSRYPFPRDEWPPSAFSSGRSDRPRPPLDPAIAEVVDDLGESARPRDRHLPATARAAGIGNRRAQRRRVRVGGHAPSLVVQPPGGRASWSIGTCPGSLPAFLSGRSDNIKSAFRTPAAHVSNEAIAALTACIWNGLDPHAPC